MSADHVDAGRERRFRAATVAGAAGAGAFACGLLLTLVPHLPAPADADGEALLLAILVLALAIVPLGTLVALAQKRAPGSWMRAAGIGAALCLVGLTIVRLAAAQDSDALPVGWLTIVCLEASGVVAVGELVKAVRRTAGEGGWERWAHVVASTTAAIVAFTAIATADSTDGPVLRSDLATQLLLVAGGALAPVTLWIVLAGRERHRTLAAALALLGLAAVSADPIGAVLARRSVRVSGSDTLPINLVTVDQIRTERSLAWRGDPVGAALLGPRIEVDTRGVTVNGRSVTSVSETLGGLHDHWKAIYGWRLYRVARLDVRPVVVVTEDAEVPAVARAFADLSSGPYRFQTGRLEWNAPVVTTPAWSLCYGPPQTRVVLGRDAAGPKLGVSSSCPWGHGGAWVPGQQPWSEPRDAGGAGELRAALARACDGRAQCLLWMHPTPGKFGEVAGMMTSAFAADGTEEPGARRRSAVTTAGGTASTSPCGRGPRGRPWSRARNGTGARPGAPLRRGRDRRLGRRGRSPRRPRPPR